MTNMIPDCIKECQSIIADIASGLEDDAIRKLNSEFLGRMIASEKAKQEAKNHSNAANNIADFIKKYDRDPEFRINTAVEAANLAYLQPIKPSSPDDMEFRYEREPLQWVKYCPHIWKADSKYHDDGLPFTWRIDENDYGKYEISNSTPELITCLECLVFDTLDDAKRFCEEEEAFDTENPWKECHEIANSLHKEIAEPHVRVIKGVRLYPPASFDVIYKKGLER